MHETGIDKFDLAILDALQRDGAMTNATLSDQINLSASQCSRRRAALESAGLIRNYTAVLDAERLGFGLHAVVRVNLRAHGQGAEADFHRFLDASPQVRAAHSVSGDADYVLDILVRDLAAFADFIHNRLLPHPHVAQVRSEIVLKTLKDRPGLPLG